MDRMLFEGQRPFQQLPVTSLNAGNVLSKYPSAPPRSWLGKERSLGLCSGKESKDRSPGQCCQRGSIPGAQLQTALGLV